MRSKRTRSSMKVPFSPDADLEKGNSFKHFQDERPFTEEPPEISEEQPPGDDDSDNNDKFWKMFQEEAAAEASWKVDIWKTELDSLLVFAGLFAAVVSAFVIDLRFHLRPDPVLLALNNIASILRNESEPPEVEHARSVVRGVGFLWYGSLVVTLIGALWGVLAKGWLGALLREPPNNPADRAMERWRRDEATKKWHMETVVTGVPLLTQIGLAMFLSGFVVQSFDDNRGIGVLVLVFVTLGVLAYAIFTLLPLFLPDCPYRTPLTNIVKPVSSAKATSLDEDIFSKIQILVSRLNRSSNDEIFTSAASVLDAKLESPDWEKWFNGVEMRAYEIAEAFSVRLKSFAHRVHTIRKVPTLSMMRDVANSPTTGGEALMGTLYSHSPTEQGITCLRVLLKSIEASINPEGDKSPWIKQDIDRHWRTSEIYPPAWRLLSLSIHITKLVAREDDYSGDDAVEIDWKTLISKTFPDLTLRSISGASACRGLLHGQPNLRRICALGLAMFIETEASSTSDSPKMLFFERDSDPGVNAGKHITEKLWDELIKIWKNSAVQIVCRARNEGDAVEGFNKLLNHELYQEDIKRSIVNIISKQLDDSVWTTRKQAIQILTKLSERCLCHSVSPFCFRYSFLLPT
ncbi:hypothetical protein BDN70DRAFT_701802 [Pholiota conissans]|uniref:DUF6535 domain-containing protein n=1 Tax=Pholiota conissans TaxID=109636 RepID=A0A9P5Z0P5_9AGAR|nr:hypothetical protein BDN70DRAFT_701802 [Pholiota conissans]